MLLYFSNRAKVLACFRQRWREHATERREHAKAAMARSRDSHVTFGGERVLARCGGSRRLVGVAAQG